MKIMSLGKILNLVVLIILSFITSVNFYWDFGQRLQFKLDKSDWELQRKSQIDFKYG